MFDDGHNKPINGQGISHASERRERYSVSLYCRTINGRRCICIHQKADQYSRRGSRARLASAGEGSQLSDYLSVRGNRQPENSGRNRRVHPRRGSQAIAQGHRVHLPILQRECCRNCSYFHGFQRSFNRRDLGYQESVQPSCECGRYTCERWPRNFGQVDKWNDCYIFPQ
jgi:hypothetical protein